MCKTHAIIFGSFLEIWGKCRVAQIFWTTRYVVILATDGPHNAVDGRGDALDVLRPTNVIAIDRQRIILPCSSHVNNESRWDFYKLDAEQPISIYNGNSRDTDTKRGISMDFDSNCCRLKTCNLTIESVRLEHAGYYVCFESSSSARKAASLVVLGQFITCFAL